MKAEPNDVGMLLNRGDALRNMHEWSRASADYSEAIRLAPDNPGGWKGRGYIQFATHDPEGAVADFSEAIKRAPNDGNLYLNRGAALSLISQNARALADVDMAIRLDPGQPLGYVNRGQIARQSRRPGRRHGLHRQGVAACRPAFRPRSKLLKKIGGKGRKGGKPSADLSQEEANNDYHLCTFPSPTSARGKDWMKKVIDACTVLINSKGGSDENRALVHLQRGSMYRRLGKFELALADFSESIRHDPNSALAWTGRGNAYRGLKLFEQRSRIIPRRSA